MSPMLDDDLEHALHELLERQAHAIPVRTHAWDATPVAAVAPIDTPRRRRAALTAIAGIAAATALVVGVAAIGTGGKGVHVGGQPGVPAAVHFETEQVNFAASALEIDAHGQTFTAGGATVDVSSDPGDAHYQTLELIWHERGIEMRMFIYFAADARDWWATEIRTYNGKPAGDWIEYMGTRWRTPLGSAFTGDIDLRPTDGQSGRLRIANLRLQAFRPAPACSEARGTYAIESNEGAAITLPEPETRFDGTVTLFSRATCRAVATPGRFEYRFTSSAPDVVSVEPLSCPVGLPNDYCPVHTYFALRARTVGSVTVHVVAVDAHTRAAVAQTDVQVKVKR